MLEVDGLNESIHEETPWKDKLQPKCWSLSQFRDSRKENHTIDILGTGIKGWGGETWETENLQLKGLRYQVGQEKQKQSTLCQMSFKGHESNVVLSIDNIEIVNLTKSGLGHQKKGMMVRVAGGRVESFTARVLSRYIVDVFEEEQHCKIRSEQVEFSITWVVSHREWTTDEFCCFG